MSPIPAPSCVLNGAPNFRDLGRLVTRNGGRVRSGHVLRSGSLVALDDGDLERLGVLGIRLLCDLRSPLERQLHPSRWPPGALWRELHLDINADMHAHNATLADLLLADPTPAGARRMMLHTYSLLPMASAPRLGRLFEALAEADDGLPVLIHCTAGKDRTGVVCALLVHALDVPMDQIHDDYLLSATRCNSAQLAREVAPIVAQLIGREPNPDIIATMNTVEPDYLEAAFASIEREHGSVDAYLQAAGLTRELRRRLRARLVEC